MEEIKSYNHLMKIQFYPEELLKKLKTDGKENEDVFIEGSYRLKIFQ